MKKNELSWFHCKNVGLHNYILLYKLFVLIVIIIIFLIISNVVNSYISYARTLVRKCSKCK